MTTDSMRDWPLMLIRSEARDTLALRIYEARCAWRRVRADWSAEANRQEREDCRALALRILEGGIS